MARYWVGGTSTWDATAGVKWALTSGGAGGEAVPTSSDDVFFDLASGVVTVTVSAGSVSCLSLDFTGFTGSFTGSGTKNVFGNLTFSPTMTTTNQSFVMQATVAASITTNGQADTKAILTFAGTGTFQFLDDFIGTGLQGTVGGSNSTINTNNHNITLSRGSGALDFLVATTWNFGSSLVTFTGTSTLVGVNVATSSVVNAGTSTFKFTNTSTSAITFRGRGFTFYNVWFARGTSTGSITIDSSNTFNNIKDTGTAAHSLLFTVGTTQTVASFTVSGTAGNLITINSTTTGTHALVKTGGLVSVDYLNIQHSVVTPANAWYAGLNSTNNQAVATAGSGWVFINPSLIVQDTKGSNSLTGDTRSTAGVFTNDNKGTNSLSGDVRSGAGSFTNDNKNAGTAFGIWISSVFPWTEPSPWLITIEGGILLHDIKHV